jgi:hypothetical protein
MLLGEERPHQLRVNNPVSGCNIPHPSLTHHLPRNPNLVKVCQELLAFNSYEANPSLTKNSRALTQLTKTHPASYINAPYTYYIFFIYTLLYIYYYILSYSILYYIMLCYVIIYYIISHYIILCYIILYYIVLYYIILYYIILYYVILYYIVFYYIILYLYKYAEHLSLSI